MIKEKMKQAVLLLGGAAGLVLVSACSYTPELIPESASDYGLDTVFQVEGRQGVACDGSAYYISDSKALYKYSMSGELLLSNTSPFQGLEGAMNHLGDIDVLNGELYAGAENFINGHGENIQIVVYDLETLKVKRSIPWEAGSGQVEVCGLAVDTLNNSIWLADWLHGEHLYRYDLETGTYLGKMGLDPVPFQIQGISVAGNLLYLTADDGDAELDKPDHLYVVNLDQLDDASPKPLLLEKTLVEFRRTGEVEGLCMSPQSQNLVVLMNCGARIIVGMPQGFYPGYDHEIHEVYVYHVHRR